MSILKRFADIMSANFNGIIDKFEDPEKMIDQYLRNLEKDLGKVKNETAEVMAIQKKAEARFSALRDEQAKWLGLAKKAVEMENEEDAAKFTEELIKVEDNIAIQANAVETAKENSQRMLAMHDKLMGDMEVLRSQRDELMSRSKIAKAAVTVESITGNFASSIGNNISGYNRMKDKIEDSIRKADAMHELNNRPVSDAEARAQKYTSTDSVSERVSARLAQIKSA